MEIVKGKVIHGEKIGRKQGFPTANLSPRVLKNKKLSPGVYLAKAQLKGRLYPCLLILGVPGVRIWRKGKVEIYFLQPVGNIYGQWIGVSILKKLRNLVPAGDKNKLISQIEKDIKIATEYFKQKQLT